MSEKIVEMTKEMIAEEVTPSPVTLPSITKDESNALNMEIMAIQNLELQGKLLHKDLEELARQMKERQTKLHTSSEALFSKYGMVFGRDRIGPDGKFIKG